MKFDDIIAAKDRIAPFVKRTRLERSESLTKRIGVETYVKYELFQKTGSFKTRGAFNKLLLMSDEERSHGVVAVSGGNHAQAVAYASARLGVDAVIIMPQNTPQNYLNATREYGATVELMPSIADAFERAAHIRDEGRLFLHPFDDPEVAAAQGTVGLEIVEDLPDVTDVIVSIGGGGLAGAVGCAVRTLSPDAKVWGVETEGADSMSQAVIAGQPVELDAITSIAKTLGAPYVSEFTLSLFREYLGSVTVVTDTDAVEAMVFIAERLKVLTEPAASCTLPAAEKLRENFSSKTKLVLIFCGGNVGVADLCSYLKN